MAGSWWTPRGSGRGRGRRRARTTRRTPRLDAGRGAAEETFLYRLASFPVRLWRRWARPARGRPLETDDFYAGAAALRGAGGARRARRPLRRGHAHLDGRPALGHPLQRHPGARRRRGRGRRARLAVDVPHPRRPLRPAPGRVRAVPRLGRARPPRSACSPRPPSRCRSAACATRPGPCSTRAAGWRAGSSPRGGATRWATSRAASATSPATSSAGSACSRASPPTWRTSCATPSRRSARPSSWPCPWKSPPSARACSSPPSRTPGAWSACSSGVREVSLLDAGVASEAEETVDVARGRGARRRGRAPRPARRAGAPPGGGRTRGGAHAAGPARAGDREPRAERGRLLAARRARADRGRARRRRRRAARPRSSSP